MSLGGGVVAHSGSDAQPLAKRSRTGHFPGLLHFLNEDLIECILSSLPFRERGGLGAHALARAARSCRAFGLVAPPSVPPGSPSALLAPRLSAVDLAARAHCRFLGVDKINYSLREGGPRRDGWNCWTHMLAWVTSAARVAPLPSGLPQGHPVMVAWKARLLSGEYLFSSIASAIAACNKPSGAGGPPPSSCRAPSGGATQLLIVEPGVYEDHKTATLGLNQRIAIWPATCSSFGSSTVSMIDESSKANRESVRCSANSKNQTAAPARVFPGAYFATAELSPSQQSKPLPRKAAGLAQTRVGGPQVTWRSVDVTTVCVKGKKASLEIRGVKLVASMSAAFHGDGFCGIGCWQGGSVHADECDLTSESLSVVECGDKGSNCSLSHCDLHDAANGAGIYVHNGAATNVLGTEVWGNTFAGCIARDLGTVLTLVGCVVRDGKADGVHVHSAATCVMHGSDIVRNQSANIIARDENTSVTLRQCQVFEGSAGGVEVMHKAAVVMHANFLSRNTLNAIEVGGSSRASLTNNRIWDGGACGAFIHTGSKATLEDNDIARNANDCVGVRDVGSDVVLRRNDIHDGGEEGLSVYNGASLLAEDNTIHGNDLCGIGVYEGSKAILVGNSVSNNGFCKDKRSTDVLELWGSASACTRHHLPKYELGAGYPGLWVTGGSFVSSEDNHIEGNNPKTDQIEVLDSPNRFRASRTAAHHSCAVYPAYL